jgi:hypothetical protein
MDFLYGEIANDIPPEFAPPEMWPEYGHVVEPVAICRREEVGESPRGIRWSFWPITFEQYISDEEPDLKQSKRGKLAYSRSIMWRRIRRKDIPPGWKSSNSIASQIDGFRFLTEDVEAGWNHDARKGMRVWKRRYHNITHRIELISFQEYKHAYLSSLIAKRLDSGRVKVLERKLRLPKVAEHAELWVVREMSTGRIVAGTALIHSPTYKASTHFAPFIHEEARRIHAATALVHHWFSRAKARGDLFVTTTNFWFPGKPDSWKGFSEFKSHFGWQYIAYPPELTRFVWGRLF